MAISRLISFHLFCPYINFCKMRWSAVFFNQVIEYQVIEFWTLVKSLLIWVFFVKSVPWNSGGIPEILLLYSKNIHLIWFYLEWWSFFVPFPVMYFILCHSPSLPIFFFLNLPSFFSCHSQWGFFDLLSSPAVVSSLASGPIILSPPFP